MRNSIRAGWRCVTKASCRNISGHQDLSLSSPEQSQPLRILAIKQRTKHSGHIIQAHEREHKFQKNNKKTGGGRTKKVKIIYLNSLSTQSLSSCFLSPWMHIASYLRRRLLLVKSLNLILQLGNLRLSATSSLVHE